LFGKLEMFRVFDASGDGIRGLHADRFGQVLLVHLLRGATDLGTLQNELEDRAVEFAALAHVTSLYLRVHEQDARASAIPRAKLLTGPCVTELELEEHGIRYRLNLEESVNAGLFLDTREIRASLKESANGKRVLNTFCYTGSLGLAAFCGGAREVVQVDISKSILGRAKENLQLNHSAATGEMRFICEDSRAFMRREVRRRENGKEGYDLIIVDPPSFGSCKNVRFQFERDVDELIELSLALLVPGGRLILCTNLSRFSGEELVDSVRTIGKKMGRRAGTCTVLTAPDIDFPDRSENSSSVRGVDVTFP
jgi:23S rRNA G2069 N7-methylase RlmK/C1962 C5-methylase RlmI